MKYGEFLQRFSEETTIDTHAVEGENGFTLTFVDQTQINFELSQDGHFFDVHTVLMEVPSSHKAIVYEALLRGHLFGLKTAGLAFGLSPQEDKLLIFTRIDLDHCLKEELRALALAFIAVRQDWLMHLARLTDATSSKESDELESSINTPLGHV